MQGCERAIARVGTDAAGVLYSTAAKGGSIGRQAPGPYSVIEPTEDVQLRCDLHGDVDHLSVQEWNRIGRRIAAAGLQDVPWRVAAKAREVR